MQRDARTGLKELRVDGGATRNDALLQFQADIMQLPVVRSSVTETTALGAAMLAGIGAGLFADLAAAATMHAAERVFTPASDDEARIAGRARWARAVRQALTT